MLPPEGRPYVPSDVDKYIPFPSPAPLGKVPMLLVFESVDSSVQLSGIKLVEMPGVMETMRVTQAVPLGRVPPGGLGTSSRFAVQEGDWEGRAGQQDVVQKDVVPPLQLRAQHQARGPPASRHLVPLTLGIHTWARRPACHFFAPRLPPHTGPHTLFEMTMRYLSLQYAALTVPLEAPMRALSAAAVHMGAVDLRQGVGSR